MMVDATPMVVELADMRPIVEAPWPLAPAPPSPVEPPPPRPLARPTPRPPPPQVIPIPASAGPSAEGTHELSEVEAASAATAGAGAGGGGCNMIRRLQAALRKDRHVQAAMAQADRGRAIRVWNGEWVRHAGQEGDGMAAVRESIMWEVGFAPEACRSEAVRGPVLISLDDSPGAARLVVGAGDWRWSDLLGRRHHR